MKNPIISILSILILLTAAAEADDLRLPNIFGGGMVLQRDKPISIWGWATPGGTVAVEFAGQSKTAIAANDGSWLVALDPIEASVEPRSLEVSANAEALTISDILVGEVWVCGGQSNMEFTLGASRDADLELAAADFDQIRFIRLPRIASPEPQSDSPVENPESSTGNWRKATSDQAENCTAVGYYFAKRLHRQLKVPIGIIDNSWGGTMAQHWCSRESLTSIEEMQTDIEAFDSKLREWIDGGGEAGAETRLAADLAAWEAAKAKGEKEAGRPNPNSYKNPGEGRSPAGLYNGSLLPISNSTIRGVLFYQGENNSFGTSWKPFHRTFPTVISDWRAAFGDPDLPFGIIQIAGWSNRRSMEYDMNHHTNVVREIQFDTWRSTPDTGLIVTFDANSNGSIHPGRKLPVGERSARWALAKVYGTKRARSNDLLEWRGPVYVAAEFVEGKAIITFEEGTNRGLRLDQDVDVGFVLAGEDRVFHHARARVVQPKGAQPHVEVWNDDVPAPVAVRYAFSNLPMGGLMNGRELPAYPFRSDDWPMTPHQSTGAYVRGGEPVVSAITDAQAEEYDLDTSFFKKGVLVQGILIATSDRISDFAILESAYLFDQIMRSIDQEVADRIRSQNVLCILVGHDEMTSDVPQFATDKTGKELDFYNWRQRGFLTRVDGRRVVLFAEEDVLEYEGGMQIESILIHEFGHVIDGAGFSEDQKKRLTEAFNRAKFRGLWNDGRAAQRFRRVTSAKPVSLLGALTESFPGQPKELHRMCLDSGDILVNGIAVDSEATVTKDDNVLIVFGGEKKCYASRNQAEYWAEGVQCWYNTNRTMDHDHNHIQTRAGLKAYDPDLAALCEEVLGDHEWRFVSPRERVGQGHLKDFDLSKSPKVVDPDHIKAAANDYYDEYWSSFWNRLREKHGFELIE
ncbi:MAG: sialate O-acetylesterase [Verrucomicrobiales bacterium]|jgi:sialate O-acetylesterase